MIWDIKAYHTIFLNRTRFAWDEIAEGLADFPEWLSLPMPASLSRKSDQLTFWQRYFARYFDKKWTTYTFASRLLCSVMIAATQQTP